eukprot:345049-Hanusia_phi.AAC.1
MSQHVGTVSSHSVTDTPRVAGRTHPRWDPIPHAASSSTWHLSGALQLPGKLGPGIIALPSLKLPQ